MLRLAASAIVIVGLFAYAVSPTAAVAAGPVTRSLDRSLPEMKFTGVTFGEAIEFVRDVSGLNIHVNWKALEGQNVTPDTPVNIRLRSVSLRKVLNLLLSEAAGNDSLAWSVDGGVVEITTKELADKKLYTRIYPVEDLLMEVPDFDNAPDFNLQSTTQQGQGGGSGGGGGSGTSIFGSSGSSDRKEDEPKKTKTERADDLVQLIKELVQPEIWADAGGPANVRYFNGNLIVTAPKSVHEAIAGSWD